MIAVLLLRVLPGLFCLGVLVVVGAVLVQPATDAVMRGICRAVRAAEARNRARVDVHLARALGEDWR